MDWGRLVVVLLLLGGLLVHHSGADPGVEGSGRRAVGDLWLYHRPCLGRYGGALHGGAAGQ